MSQELVFLFLIIILLITGSFVPVIAREINDSAKNPIIWADVPDPSVINVEGTYYMSSTTMHMNPGVPIMKSGDLKNWEIINYAYDVLAENDQLNLKSNQNAYGEGTWASSLRYHEGTYYISTFSHTTGKTHIFQTDDIEGGSWEEYTIDTVYHDNSLLFDKGRVYLVYGGGDIGVVELTSDATAVKKGGVNETIIKDAGQIAGSDLILNAEGSHIYKVDGSYYIFLITWPEGGNRTQIVYRSDKITGPYEGKIVLDDDGIAQGGIVETEEGDWYAMLFQDHGSVGRIPYLVPVTWEDGWPIFGIDGRVPRNLDISNENKGSKIVSSDDFNYESEYDLSPVWQWNHNPVDEYWSVTKRPGYLRLTNGRIDADILDTRNTLTQRTSGPECSGQVVLDTSGMKDGDYAGLAALQEKYGFAGIKKSGDSKSIVMVNGSTGSPEEVESISVDQDKVYLKIDFDFKNMRDRVYFYYSLDGEDWTSIGNVLQMSYELSHFVGYRFALFNFATKTAGGYVDFDYFRIEDEIMRAD